MSPTGTCTAPISYWRNPPTTSIVTAHGGTTWNRAGHPDEYRAVTTTNTSPTAW